jgi:hypothetical protein
MSALEQLERIRLEGTKNADGSYEGKPSNVIECVDGFTVSVIAGVATYCTPRPDGFGDTAAGLDYQGPYTAVEVGFPSQRPEPWAEWRGWSESPGYPTSSVYKYVPVSAVRALIALHEGVTL